MKPIDHASWQCQRCGVMNFLRYGIIPVILALPACETMNSPVTSSSFDPLTPPGSSIRSTVDAYDDALKPGQFVTATIPNTAFYKAKPGPNQDADKLLDRGTAMKIVAVESSVVKVELDSGEVGYVPAVMITNPQNTPVADVLPYYEDGTFQVYPPLPGGTPTEPLPIIDPSGLPPDGAIPAIIDPDAPAISPGVPPTLDGVPEMQDVPTTPPTEAELDPVAEEVRKKVEAAMKEEAEKNAAEGALNEPPPATE